jgi:signal transduction histidine kinase
VNLEVVDRGPGIAEDEVSRVFEKFYRSRTAKITGSGLGLSIARRIVTDLDGRITLRSTEGQGATVTLSLPIAEEE